MQVCASVITMSRATDFQQEGAIRAVTLNAEKEAARREVLKGVQPERELGNG